MVPVTSFLAILPSAVAVFRASSVVHLLLPSHKGDFRRVPSEEDVMNALRCPRWRGVRCGLPGRGARRSHRSRTGLDTRLSRSSS